MATFLDPRFVSLTPFVPDYDRAGFGRDVLVHLKDLADEICQSEPEHTNPATQVPSSSTTVQVAAPPPAKKACVDPNPFWSSQAFSAWIILVFVLSFYGFLLNGKCLGRSWRCLIVQKQKRRHPLRLGRP